MEIENLGIQFLRFTNEQVVFDLNNVLEEIKKMITSLENLKLIKPPLSPPSKGGERLIQ